MPKPSSPEILQLPVDAIAPDPDQPRQRFDETKLEELAATIRTSSVLQPVTVTRNTRPDVEAPYLLLFGARRFLAAQRAGLTEVPAIVRDGGLSPAVRILLQLAENEQREDLTLFERARAYQRALQASGLDITVFADQSGIRRSLLSRYLWVARSEGLVGEALGADLLRHLETARLYSRLPAKQQLRVLRAARRTGEPITLSKVQRAQAAAEAYLPDPLEIDELAGGDLPAGTVGVIGFADSCEPVGSGDLAVAPMPSFPQDPSFALPLADGSSPTALPEEPILVPFTISRIAYLLRWLGLTPPPDPDEAVRILLSALPAETP